MGQIKITETSLRDAHQSLIATRLTTSEIIPILEKMDKVGFHSLEVWGGATFDSCLRYLNEDPWQRLREIRKRVKNTKLQMLLRGQNLLGYKHYPDDVVEAFVKKSVENGIDIIRVFDALNDVRNLQTSMKAIKEAGAHCQAAISYTISKVHTVDYYLSIAKEMENLGADSICIKDMAGILTPAVAFELVKRLKETVSVPLQIHTHCTSGIAEMTYLKAAEAGIDIIDTAMSPLSGGTSQPATESMVVALGSQGERAPQLDLKLLSEIADYFKPIRDKYRENGLLSPKVKDTEPNTLTYQIPGGMLSNLLNQLKAQGAENRFEEVLKEVPTVREDLGYPPLVTPLSQMVGTQSVINVLSGERYKMVPKEIKEYCKGLYGKPPAPINEDVKKLAIGDDEVIAVRPADLIEPGLDKFKEEIGNLATSLEDVLSYALFPQVAKKFFEERAKGNKVPADNEEETIQYVTVTM